MKTDRETVDLAGGEPGVDPRVLELVKEYQAELDCGRRPDRARYLARHPDLAAELAQYLDGLDFLRQGVKGFSGSGPRPGRLDTGLSRGDRLGEYEIVREVGRGGMGIVYEAWQPSLKRRVAVKVLPPGFAADRTRLRRFAVEAQAAAAVDHPHIVPVYAVGEERGVNYYVMKLVAGVSLDALAAGVSTESAELPAAGTNPDSQSLKPNSAPGPADTPAVNPAAQLVRMFASDRRSYHRAVAGIGADVARALDHAHQSGVVHRDVKPANLLLESGGHVWVTDFGLAQLAVGPAVTRSGATIGTFRYMSPEQAVGDRGRLDHRTDIYSLAASMYELLAGRSPFPGEEPAVLITQIVHDDPSPLRALDPLVPFDLETIVIKAMQKDPRDRYTTASELAEDLERFLTGRPVLARRPSVWERAKRWAGRYPVAVAAVLVSLLVIGAASAVAAGLVAAEQQETKRAYQAERDRADEAEKRFRQSKELSDLVLRISEEEIGTDSPFQGPRRRLLLAAFENYRTLQADGNDPAVRRELDQLLVRVEKLLAEQTAVREAEALFHLGDRDVWDELGLTAEQVERVQHLLPVRSRGPGPHGPDMHRLMADPVARNGILSSLTAAQRQRLRQIHFQSRGVMAFNEPEVTEELHLTSAQRRQIKLLQGEWLASFGPPQFASRPAPGPPSGSPPSRSEGFGPGRPGERPGAPGPQRPNPAGPPTGRPDVPNPRGDKHGGPPGNPKADSRFNPELTARMMERILAVLTPEQRTSWEVLIGKPFVSQRTSGPGS